MTTNAPTNPDVSTWTNRNGTSPIQGIEIFAGNTLCILSGISKTRNTPLQGGICISIQDLPTLYNTLGKLLKNIEKIKKTAKIEATNVEASLEIDPVFKDKL